MKETIAVLFARFYNFLPKELRIPVFALSSALIGGLALQFTNDINGLDLNNPYLVLLRIFAVGLVVALTNYIQTKFVDLGDKELAKEGNEKVLEKYTAKVKEATKVQKIAEKAQS